MIEIRTFDGDPAELAAFTVGVWRQTYEGRMLLMLWSADYLRRELFPEDDRCRPFLIAAYDGSHLVGSHPSRPLRVRLHGQEIPATWGSFLSVDPEYRRQGVALRLQHEWARRHREQGMCLNFGYQYVRSRRALGPKFWLQQPERIPIVHKLGTWVRPLDHAAVARFQLHRLEAWGSRLLGLWQRRPRPPRGLSGIRAYQPSDLESCQTLVAEAGASADLAYLWDDAMLGRQLQFPPVSETMVLERDGRVAGLVNYSLLEVLGRCQMTVALIELLAFGSLRFAERRGLVQAALYQMAARGAKAAMMLRASTYGRREMWVAGFLPTPTEYYFLGAPFHDGLRLDGVRQLQVVLR